MSCSIASIFLVCRAMILCIYAFSASSYLSRDKSLALMPAYFVRHIESCSRKRRYAGPSLPLTHQPRTRRRFGRSAIP
jgi:hypothetical protein